MKYLLSISYLFLTIILLLTFRTEPRVWGSFALNGFVLFIIFFYHIFYEKNFSPFLSAFIVFNYLFLFFAPIAQIGNFTEVEKAKFPQYFPYKESLVIYTNFLIVFFNLIFFVLYVFAKQKIKPAKTKYNDLRKKYAPLLIFILLFLSFFIFVITFPIVLDEIKKPYWAKLNISKMYTLIINKTLLFLPFAGIILAKNYLKNASKNNNYYLISIMILFFLLILLWFKNPLNEKRNALGPLYITLIYIFKPKWLNSNLKMMLFLFFSMIIAFPLMALITHSSFSLTELFHKPSLLIVSLKKEGIVHVFHTLHYDAFANIMATIDYVTNNGITWGKQLLGVLTFYIPRSIWETKPIGTGQFIGRYLINKYHFVFDNLSNPLISEGYINFGIIGVILMAIFLVYFIKKMLSWLNGNCYLKKILAFYFSLHLIFLLRGDLLNGVAYFAGVVIAVWIIPSTIERFLFILFQINYDDQK